MKNIKLIGLIAIVSIVFMGCPYSTEVPIDKASIKTDTKLMGKWESKDSTLYTISKGDEFTYAIESKSVSSTSSGQLSHYKAFISDVNGTKFLNLMEDGSNSYYIYKITLNSNASAITLAELTDNIDEKFTTSAELKKFIQANMGLSFFYGKDETEYTRVN